jgi:hypothetical protein
MQPLRLRSFSAGVGSSVHARHLSPGARRRRTAAMNASEVEIREANSAGDRKAAATLMADYLTWGSARNSSSTTA